MVRLPATFLRRSTPLCRLATFSSATAPRSTRYDRQRPSVRLTCPRRLNRQGESVPTRLLLRLCQRRLPKPVLPNGHPTCGACCWPPYFHCHAERCRYC